MPLFDLPPARVDVLSCGLTVVRIPTRRPLVATALAYRVGARNDPPGHAGSAHFLEHLMFRGAERFGPGEIDRTTRRLGGTDNAWTSHDTTVYHFAFASDRWKVALDIEVDRMRGLALEPEVVEAERRIVLEEIAMYEAEPWDVLEQATLAAHFAGHPYGRPVLGTRNDLAATGPEEVRAFHAAWLRPENAVLALAGDVGSTNGTGPDRLLAEIEERFRTWPSAEPVDRSGNVGDSMRGAVGDRVVRTVGEVPRLLLVLPGPEADLENDVADLRLALGVLASGRASRLQRRLVDDEELCVWVTADAANMVEPGCITLAAELHLEADPERVEAALREELLRLAAAGVEREELERARRVLLADWLFGHERVDQLATLWATTLAWTDPGAPERFLRRLATATAADVRSAAERWLVREPIVGLARPEPEPGA